MKPTSNTPSSDQNSDQYGKASFVQIWVANWRLYVLIIVYIVGLIGLSQTGTIGDLFLLLTPINLLLTLYLFISNAAGLTNQQVMTIAAIAVAGYLVEVLGVHTGLIFGHYWYGKALGIKLFEVPLVIGINWAILIYGMTCWMFQFKLNGVLKAALGAVLLTFFDWVMEPVAISLDFWQWKQDVIPLQNYIGWFITSLALLLFTQGVKQRWQNDLSGPVLLIQLLFFATLRFFILQ